MNMTTTNPVNYIINSICLPDRYPSIYQCSICLENLNQNDESDPQKTCETNCFHTFHIDCIKQWSLLSHTNCPVCKSISISLQPIKFRTEDDYKELQKDRINKLKKLTPDIYIDGLSFLSQEDENYIDDLSLEDLNTEIYISLRSAGDSFSSSEAHEYHINYHTRLEERIIEIEMIEREVDYLYNMHMGVREADYNPPPLLHILTPQTELIRIFTPIENNYELGLS